MSRFPANWNKLPSSVRRLLLELEARDLEQRRNPKPRQGKPWDPHDDFSDIQPFTPTTKYPW